MTKSPAETVAEIEAGARRLETPCGDGAMIWRRWGSGPPLVLLPGGHGSWTHWIRNIPVLAKSRTVLAADLPGEGQSAVPPDPIGLDSIVDIVIDGLHRVVPENESFDIVGFSFGGLIGGIVAGRLGSRVRNLVLAGTAGLGQMQRNRALKSLRGLTDPAEIDAVYRYNMEALLFAKAENIDDLAVYLQTENIRQGRVKGHPHGGDERLRSELPRLQAHIHAVWGEGDVTPGSRMREYGEFLTSLKPAAEFTVIPDAGHWVSYEAADRFNQILGALGA